MKGPSYFEIQANDVKRAVRFYQAIFGWNGADAGYLTGFGQRFPSAELVRLDDNYRSSPQILAVADAVLTATSSDRSRPLRANRPEGPTPSVRSWASDRDEARAVVRAMRRRQNSSLPWSGMAAGFLTTLLFRTHVAYTWYVLLGSLATFAVGYAASFVLPRRLDVRVS